MTDHPRDNLRRRSSVLEKFDLKLPGRYTGNFDQSETLWKIVLDTSTEKESVQHVITLSLDQLEQMSRSISAWLKYALETEQKSRDELLKLGKEMFAQYTTNPSSQEKDRYRKFLE